MLETVMKAKWWFLFLTFACHLSCLPVEHVSLRIESRNNFLVLDQFFRMQVSEEEYGYVLEGIKPISIRDYYALDEFPVAKDLAYSEKEFTNTLLVREVIPVWNKLCAHQKNFVLKAVALKTPKSEVPGWEIQFINMAKLRDVIDKNIDLFRYILGPVIETEQLVNNIAFSREPLPKILHNDCVLIGIVLGFGHHNSLVGGRVETLHALSFSWESPPFYPKSLLLQCRGNPCFDELTPERYGAYYLAFAGGDDSFFRTRASIPPPSLGFSHIEEELVTLKAMEEPLPSPLYNKRPSFVFAAYKGGPSNPPFFKRLQHVQKQAQNLLGKPDFLKQILEKIGGAKPGITCDQSPFAGSIFSLTSQNTTPHEWAYLIQAIAKRFEDKKDKTAFIKAFTHPSASSQAAPEMIGVSKATLEGLNIALGNLAAANAHFEALSKDTSLHSIVKQQLYSKITLSGSGKQLQDADRVRIGYVIEDLESTILFANYDTWISLSQTIAGLAHGVQGMHVGEKRTLFIHPSLAYGALTTLPPCSELIIKVHLRDIDETTIGTLPPLQPLDLRWLQDIAFYRVLKQSIQQQPGFIGSFYSDILDKIESLDKTAILHDLDTKTCKFSIE
jgi:FKBP-type peptidyl-prolyl cis-trans isomerase